MVDPDKLNGLISAELRNQGLAQVREELNASRSKYDFAFRCMNSSKTISSLLQILRGMSDRFSGHIVSG